MANPLARRISLPLLTFYGLGTILGAGIYVLIGEVTLRAGQLAPLSFITAALIAGITAYSFARLSSFYPQSAGEAAYTFAAFNSPHFSALVGLAVVTVGSVSAATMVKGFAGYFIAMVPVPEIGAVVTMTLIIAGLAIWGISQSLIAASLVTIVEVFGLLFVIFVVSDVDAFQGFSLPESNSIYSHSAVIFYAAFISFYAYIGFEDIVNIAEETVNPTRVVPMAIVLSMLVSTLLYVILSVACTAFIPAEVFNTSRAPLVAIVEYKGHGTLAMALISIIAILNGALIQLIMASRVLYGMGKQKMFFPIFAAVNPKTRTPVVATVTITGVILILVTLLNLVTLAEITSAITLCIFIAVQASLFYLAVKKQTGIKMDIILPTIGIVLNFGLIFFGFYL